MVRFAQHGHPAVGVEVDEAGADDVLGGVDHAGRFEGRGVATVNGDPLIFDQHGGMEAGTPTPVDHQAICNE